MAPLAALLWRSLRVHQVYGANTDVGKTILTTILCNAATKGWRDEAVAYLKPVSTGASEDADERYGVLMILRRHIRTFAPSAEYETLLQYDLPASPHSAAQLSGKPIPSDQALLGQIYSHASNLASRGPGWLFLETAGGVHSPGPSGTTQAELYTPLRAPVILVGDSKLGGISQTISAFESLRLRGYDVESVLLFREGVYENYRHLTDYFGDKYAIPVSTVAEPPERNENVERDLEMMREYYDEQSSEKVAHDVLTHLDARHQARITRLDSMAEKAHSSIWYPFTQHTLLPAEKITAIDSAHGDYFQTLKPASATTSPESPLLQASFDGSASWWTQGLGHANSRLTLASAYAAGRYGHVMFAEAIHEPALAVAEMLLSGMRNPRLSRVFFSDNGSTGCEVAVKMGLRAARVRYGWGAEEELGVLGLKGSYHGDTIGAMDCAEPCTYNEKVEWYQGKGYWFDFPTVRCSAGKWHVDVPEALQGELGAGSEFESLESVFDVESREANGEGEKYVAFIRNTLQRLQAQGRKFGALMLEPVILGAGGMLFVDPLFQRTLVNTVRDSAHLIASSAAASSSPVSSSPTAWTGLPVIFDEVFTGLYRLGRFTSSSFLGVHPDISVHAKLLTGGLVPLCTTLASESVFEVFRSEDKTDALLHGHSYTAHPVGCQVALESVTEMMRMEDAGEWSWAKQSWPTSPSPTSHLTPRAINDSQVWSIWPLSLVTALSHHQPAVSGVWALGSVLAIALRDASGATGYTSTAATELQRRLREGGGRGWNVHARVLGNVAYVMAGQTTTRESVEGVERLLREGLGLGC